MYYSGWQRLCLVTISRSILSVKADVELRCLQQNTFAPIVPLIPFLPIKQLKDACYGLHRVFAYSQERMHEYLALPLSEKKGSIMAGYLDENGQPKPPYNPWCMSLSGHGFM